MLLFHCVKFWLAVYNTVKNTVSADWFILEKDDEANSHINMSYCITDSNLRMDWPYINTSQMVKKMNACIGGDIS